MYTSITSWKHSSSMSVSVVILGCSFNETTLGVFDFSEKKKNYKILKIYFKNFISYNLR